MAQDFVLAAYHLLLSAADVFMHLAPWIVIAAIACAGFWLAYRRLEPQRAAEIESRIWLRRLAQAALLSLVVLLGAGALVQARKTIDLRRTAVQQATASRRREPQLSGVVQFAPVVAMIQDKTYTRTLTLPPDFLTRVGVEGIQVLSPYLQDPTSENVLKLVDSFRRSGKDVVFTRELTRRDELPIAADAADVKLDFHDEGAPSGRRHYDAELTATYIFRNSSGAASPMRFQFPLPQGGGTMQQFYIQVGDQKITEPDEHGLYAWTGTVQPDTQVRAVAHYRVTGAAQFDYMLGSERRRIGDFHLIATSARMPQFGKSGIYPSALSGSQAEWRLRDVLTAQSISLVFPKADLDAQLLDKTLSLAPLLLVIVACLAAWISFSRAAFATGAFAVGLLGIAVLSAYASPSVATILGSLLGGALFALVLREARAWIVGALAAIMSMAFLTAEHGSLVVWVCTGILGAALVAAAVTRRA